MGAALKYSYYDDDTPASSTPEVNWLPGLFVQDQLKISAKSTMLSGLRSDFHREHGVVAPL
ncbi:MAG: hypothetical protein IPL65_18990 [Lewinellaceae bacterium]|nr:hypothetical protein [Lewinellaceae bacterium]